MPKRTKNYHSWLLNRLTNPRAAANYLNAAMNDSSEMFLTALRNVAEARTMTKVAQEAGVNRESLYKALSEEGNPRLSTLNSVLGALGLKILVGPEQSAPIDPNQPNVDIVFNSTGQTIAMNCSDTRTLTANSLAIRTGDFPWYLIAEEKTAEAIST